MYRYLLLIPLLLQPLAAQRIKRPVPSDATMACGSEVPWASSLESAFARAKETDRPVLWYVPTLAGSRMDRKDVIDFFMMAGPFSAPTVSRLLQRRFVPVKHAPGREEAKRFGLRFGAFVEPGFLVIAPDGREVFRIDRLSTYHEGWFARLLLRILRSEPALSRPSESVAKAKIEGPAAHRRALLDEGEGDTVLKLLREASTAKDTGGEWDRREARMLAGQSPMDVFESDSTGAVLAQAAALSPPRRAALLMARWFLSGAARQEALPLLRRYADLSGELGSEAGFLLGVAAWFQGDREKADARWAKTAARTPPDRWTRKAAAEVQRFGPFARGFEIYGPLPDGALLEAPTGTAVARKREELPLLLERSLDKLLRHQAKKGFWDDSNYDFGGTDSLPNVWASVTALSALALHEWKDRDPERIQPAIDRAFDWLADDRNLAWDDKDEIVWAHVYRLLFFERLVRDGGRRAEAARKHARRIVKHLATSQTKRGHWRHEYSNPFATASVLHALNRARGAGISSGKEMRARGAQALAKNRGKNGTFSYGARRAGGSVGGSAGRMPLCEMGLYLEGLSSQERLRAALDAAFEHHALLENVRKVDDHADRYGNGGFFFWYDMHSRLEAIRLVEDQAARAAYARRHLDLVLQIPELDGTFQDSHEIGRIYGTAMALICIRGLESITP